MTATLLDPFEGVLNALRGHGSAMRQTARGYMAQCPAHDDRSPSLSVDPGTTRDGRDTVLLYCHAGCPTADVLAALSLTWADLFEPQPGLVRGLGTTRTGAIPAKRRVAAGLRRAPRLQPDDVTHSYSDPAGRVWYEKVRQPARDGRKKLLYWRHLGADGRYWLTRPAGAPRLLYRLPGLIAAKASGRHTWVAEGESDVDRLVSLNEVAVCNCDGAAETGRPKWTAQDTAWMRGAGHVTVIADNDAAGYAHARAVVTALSGVVESVRLVRTPLDGKGADVSDHLDAGYTLDQLIEIPVAWPIGGAQ